MDERIEELINRIDPSTKLCQRCKKYHQITIKSHIEVSIDRKICNEIFMCIKCFKKEYGHNIYE